MPSTLRSARHQRLADFLREARQAAGLNQVDVAEALGRHQPFVANIEQAQRRVDVVEFLTLARILKFDPAAALAALSTVPEED